MTDNSDGLIRSALRGNEETATRLRRTQLLGVLALVVANLAAPVVRVVDEGADVDLQLNLWAAIQWLADARDASDGLPASFAWLAAVLYAGLLFAGVVAPVLAVVLAVKRSGAARAAAGIAVALGAVVTLCCWLALVGETPERFADLNVTWGALLPLVLGLWTANILETDS
ncbi:hypothetical protein ACIA03_12855 [Nocardioides sp. NPDC051685]|uniref:hypothetical protein n=1 Tax=Nocardioides sp. NPDC051685 TaxID=3364334 RepID=UPI0037A0B80C